MNTSFYSSRDSTTVIFKPKVFGMLFSCWKKVGNQETYMTKIEGFPMAVPYAKESLRELEKKGKTCRFVLQTGNIIPGQPSELKFTLTSNSEFGILTPRILLPKSRHLEDIFDHKLRVTEVKIILDLLKDFFTV